MEEVVIKMKRINKAFTLVELLVVMGIIGVLVALAAGSFRSAQIRGRDAQRKSDLKQIANSLELFYADYGKYPDASGGRIAACSYNPATSTGTSCSWGTGSMTDGKTTYFKTLPADPSTNYNYVYRLVSSSSNQKYQLFARLENTHDPDLVTTTQSCGSGTTCNFGITSSNANLSDN